MLKYKFDNYTEFKYFSNFNLMYSLNTGKFNRESGEKTINNNYFI